MQRRKFIAGIGSLAAAGAAGIGTGAFTSVEADRSVDVEVAGDANAYLGLKQISGSPNSQQYVTNSSGEIGFDFSSNNGAINGDGDGFNPDATTKINSLLRVTNQGTQDVDFYVDLPSTGNAAVTIPAEDDDGNTYGDVSGSSNDVTLTPGESLVLDLEVDTNGQNPTNILNGTVTFHADATSS